MPTTKRKPKQFAFTMSTAEKRALGRISKRFRRSQADTLRWLIDAADTLKTLGDFVVAVRDAEQHKGNTDGT